MTIYILKKDNLHCDFFGVLHFNKRTNIFMYKKERKKNGERVSETGRKRNIPSNISTMGSRV